MWVYVCACAYDAMVYCRNVDKVLHFLLTHFPLGIGGSGDRGAIDKCPLKPLLFACARLACYHNRPECVNFVAEKINITYPTAW